MKKTALLFILALAIQACNKDDDDIEKHYQGAWDFSVSEGGFDTTITTNINGSGDFSYSLDANNSVTGSVDGDGNVSGSVNVSNIPAGNVNGKLRTNGTGSGNFTFLNGSSVAWTAQKQ